MELGKVLVLGTLVLSANVVIKECFFVLPPLPRFVLAVGGTKGVQLRP